MEKLNNYKVNKILSISLIDNKLDSEKIHIEFQKYFQTKAVLGFDIYKYSKYPLVEQSLIPYIFKILYEATIKICLSHETFLFQKYDKDIFQKHFIDTGDGGFKIFNNPFEAIIFAVYFQANIQRFNSGFLHNFVELRNLVGEITLRYSLTNDNVYYLNNNFYGSAIINNARILSKDKLNRFLIDENSFLWFRKILNGIENLKVIDITDFKDIELFDNYDFNEGTSYLFDFEDNSRFLNVNSLKIGEVKAKQDILSVYSIYIQTFMKSPGKKLEKITVSTGNLNSSGIL